MKTTTTMLIKTALLSVAMLYTSGFVAAETISWKVVITPSGGGTVEWATSSPATNGILTKSGTLKFDSGAYVDLTFKEQTGNKLTSVFKNADNWTAYLDGNQHFQFGPVGGAHVIVAVFSVINPTGTFNLVFPEGKATAIADVTGNYNGITKDNRNYNADVAMDESGKLSVMGAADGIVPNGGGPIQGTVGSIKTVNKNPTASLKGSFSGTKDGETTTASGACKGPLVLQDAGGSNSIATGLSSGKAQVGSVPYSLKPTTTNFTVTADQKANLSKAWDLDLTINEKTDPQTSKISLAASSILNLPNGDKTFFKEKPVTYTAKGGYSVSFTKGVKLDGAGNPIIDPNTSQPVVDKKSSVKITKMIFTGSPGNWTVTGGTMSYSFLGQKGTGDVTNFTGSAETPEETIFKNWNIGGVNNNPTTPTTFSISKAYTITYVNNYHWNYGSGTATPGQISLTNLNGTVYGPWQATGAPGQGGVPNAVWECHPNVLIEAGDYTVIDSDPATWSQNGSSGGQGFSEVRGKP